MVEKKFDNVKINVEFSEEQELKELTSGEKLSVLMGKLAKAVKDIISHLADNVRHITASERANWNGKANGTHGHSAAEISGLPSSLPANGGNANTLQNMGLSDGHGGKGIIALLYDNVPLEIGPYIDFHRGDNAGDYTARLETDLNGEFHIYSGVNGSSVMHCDISGNAYTVNGSNAWQMQTLSSGGSTHGPGVHLLYCRHNIFGDERFGLIIDSGYQTRCHYASGADNADMLDGLHADSFAAASHSHAEASQSAAGLMSAADKTKLDKIVQYFTNNGLITF